MAKAISSLGIPAESIQIQRLGIDLNQISFEPRRFRQKERLRFLISGTFREKKGIPYAIEALGHFKNNNQDFEITLIGDAFLKRDETEKQKILAKIKECSLESNIRLLGFQPFKILLNEAYRHHVLISPSVTSEDGDTEGGAPVTIIEMAASGMPIVSTTHCDIPYVLSKENGSYLVSERDSRALYDAIQRLLKSSWDDLLYANRRFIEQELDARKQGRKLYQIYLDILNE